MISCGVPIVIEPFGHLTASTTESMAQASSLWRKVSAASIAAKEMFYAALAFRGGVPGGLGALLGPLYPLLDVVEAGGSRMPWVPTGSSGSGSLFDPASETSDYGPTIASPPVSSAPGYLAYASLGPTSLLTDADRALEAAESMKAELAAFETRHSDGTRSACDSESEVVHAQIMLLKQHLGFQTELLRFARDVSASMSDSTDANGSLPR